MITYALDASAILRYLDGEAGAERVAEVLKGHLAGKNRVAISAIHWGELASVACKKKGMIQATKILSGFSALGVEVVPVTAERAVHCGFIKAEQKIPYADAFGVELACDSPEHILLTADFDVSPGKEDVRIEFLPIKAKPE